MKTPRTQRKGETGISTPLPMYRSILGTIALEPHRWTGRRDLQVRLSDLLEPIRRAGFTRLEVWQGHVAVLTVRETREIREQADALGIAVDYVGVYPCFILDGPEAREQARLQEDMLDKAGILGASALKIMLGTGLKGGQASVEQLALTAQRFGHWYREARARGISMAAELHGGTLFDPVEAGIAFMQAHPELDFSICFQPYDFTDTEKALALADRFPGRISHMHLQAPIPGRPGEYDFLESAVLDYRRLIPYVLKANPRATMTLEFVKDCIPSEEPFDRDRVLANAVRDAVFVESLMN